MNRRSIDATAPAFAIGQQVEAALDHHVEQLRAPAAAVEDDGHPPLADQVRALRASRRGKAFVNAGVDLCGDHQQRIAGAVVDPVIGAGGHGQMAARHVSL